MLCSSICYRTFSKLNRSTLPSPLFLIVAFAFCIPISKNSWIEAGG